MSFSEDIIYLSLTVASIGLSYFTHKIKNTQEKQWVSTILGFIILVIVSGKHTMFPIIMVITNYLIILSFPKRTCKWISFTFSFAQLLFFRICTYFNFDRPPDHTNAIMMFLCLKLIGLTFELDSDMKADDHLSTRPSFLNIVHYSFGYFGILVGPYYKYRTYLDMVECPFQHLIPYADFLKQRMKFVPLYAVLYLTSSYLFPLQNITSSIEDTSFLYRVLYIWAIFFSFRMRLYIGFILGECVCINAGLGCYPEFCQPRSGQGPKDYEAFKQWKLKCKDVKDIKVNFETTHSINVIHCEFVSSMRDGMRNWNMTVQYWLAVYIYKQFPVKALKVPVTMLASAVWHGVNPGYYLCLLNVPLVTMIQDRMEKALEGKLTGIAKQMLSCVYWFLTMFIFSYLSIAFLMLDVSSTFSFWKSIYFVGHVLLACMFLISVIFPSKKPGDDQKSK